MGERTDEIKNMTFSRNPALELPFMTVSSPDSLYPTDDTSSDGGDSDSDDERNLLAQTADILKDLENGTRGGANDHESAGAETGGCDDEKEVEDVDHESEKEPIAISAGTGVSADDVSAVEEMLTAAEEDMTDAGRYSIPY